MGTPFITFLGPGKLEGYKRGVTRENQPSTIPKHFLDAMEVREEVFVKEQGVTAENEFDNDDARSCHWVIYASINKTDESEVRDEEGNVIQPRKSSTRSTPIGTIRLVPFPHDPHPKSDGKYWNGILQPEAGQFLEPQEGETSAESFGVDRATTFHNGREPYVKLGRLAVVKEFRGNRIASLLVKTALDWLRANPSYFDPSIKEMGLEQMGASTERDIPKWGGLVCIHAESKAVGTWSKWGFQADDGMGSWWEEGIPHVGMFQRLKVDNRIGIRI